MVEFIQNEFITALNGAINGSQTSFALADPPTAGASDTWTLRIGDPVGDPGNYEYCRVTAVSGSAVTVVRGTDPAAQAWADGMTCAAVIDRDALAVYVAENGGGGGGGAVDLVFEVFGTPDTAFEFDTSSLSGLTALSPTPDVENADTTVPGHYYVRDDTGSMAVCGRYLGATAPFTAICKVSDWSIRDDYNTAGLFVGVATPGKMSMARVGGISRQAFVLTLANPTDAGASNSFGPLFGQIGTPAYFAIVVHANNNVDYCWSANGALWTKLHLGYDPSMTIASVGIGIFALNSTHGMAAAFDFLRIWNSAKVLPGLVS